MKITPDKWPAPEKLTKEERDIMEAKKRLALQWWPLKSTPDSRVKE